MKFTEDEKKEMQQRAALCGFKSHDTAYFDTDEYKKLRSVMLDNLPNEDDKRLKFKFCNIDSVINAGKLVVDKHTNGIDTRVLYSDGDYLSTYIIEKFGEKPKKEEYSDIVKFVKNNAKLMKVIDVPLYFSNGKNYNGFSASVFFYEKNIVDLEFYKMLPIVNSTIAVSGPCSDLSKSIYVHEMYHALLQRNKGTVKNFLHDEMLSIFMEKVGALDIDPTEELLEKRTLKRILGIKSDILYKTKIDYEDVRHLDNLEAQKYIISTLLATDLFNLYKKGSKKLKKEIDDEINKVLIGDGTLEDVIERYEVTPEKGSQLVKKQVRSFGK